MSSPRDSLHEWTNFGGRLPPEFRTAENVTDCLFAVPLIARFGSNEKISAVLSLG